jgi:hypothetical protein
MASPVRRDQSLMRQSRAPDAMNSPAADRHSTPARVSHMDMTHTQKERERETVTVAFEDAHALIRLQIPHSHRPVRAARYLSRVNANQTRQ